jgi:hypothetical protein
MRRAIPTALALASACIIPDRDIGIEGELDNPGAVRIVETTVLATQMLEICEDEDNGDPDYCPQIPSTPVRSGFISPGADEPFCVCPDGDTRSIPPFYVYAEDPDRAADRPLDRLFAVAVVDFDPDGDDPPNEAVGYAAQFPPEARPELVEDRADLGVQPPHAREENLLWRFRFGGDDGSGTDLCNDAGRTLGVGLHEIKVIVTDRPWFQPERLDENGDPLLDASGKPILGAVQYGVPDLAIGATYAVSNWVFECHDPAVNDRCNCVGDN